MVRPFDAPIESFELLQDGETHEGFHLAAWLTLGDVDTIVAAPDAAFSGLFDPRFAKALVKTASHLVARGAGSYAFAAADEIALVVSRKGVPARRLLVDLAAEASVEMAFLIGRAARFDVRLFEFPRGHFAAGFLRWRQEEARGKALGWHCQQVLGRSGIDPSRVLAGLSDDEKADLLRQNGFDVESIPAWQRRGTGVYLAGSHSADGLIVDVHLPQGDEYLLFVHDLLS